MSVPKPGTGETTQAPPSTAPVPTALDGFSDLQFLTVTEVAGVMRVSKMTVYRMVHSGELSATRVGRSFRIPAKTVREYLSEAYVTEP
jgi:excisionase family DNA binding protein